MNASSAQTRDRILDAATTGRQTAGFAAATSRTIARIGGFNQALIFYHFGSLEGLLVAAVARSSQARLERYGSGLAEVTAVEDLVRVMAELYAQDKASSHITVVSQVIAGSVGRPELAPKILELMEPWIAFAEETLERVLPPGLPVQELAYAAVTFYVGVNVLAHLDGDAKRTDALFNAAAELAPLLASVFGAAP